VAVKFSFSVISPERVVFQGDVEAVYAPGWEGEFGVLPGHAPYLVLLRVGEIRFQQDGKWTHAAISAGLCEVDYTSMKILAETCELSNEIDKERARLAKERAEQALKTEAQKEEESFQSSQAALERALNRLRVAEKGFG
jgi:F-type H+-transporting ATPase subunit epsilon